MSGRWSVMVHGGAKEIPPEKAQAHRAGCLAAIGAAVAVLRDGGGADLAAVAAVQVLEDDPTFNAGRGSVLNADGKVECDAALMTGHDLAFGAVGALRGFRHPIAVAAALRADPAFLVGDGAARFAEAMGAERCDLAAFAPASDATGCDTVGCVAQDQTGSFAAATSTGGLAGCKVGRIGDSPLPGAGLYADDAAGAVSFSGDGEYIIRTALAAHMMRDLQDGRGPVVDRALARLGRVGGEAGLILVDASGRMDFGHNSPHFAVAYASQAAGPQAMLSRAEAPSAL